MSAPSFAIRAAEPTDAVALLMLLRDLGYERLDEQKFALALGAVLRHPEMQVLVAEAADGRVVGMLSLSHRPQLRLAGTLVTIDELVVAPAARGLGAGRALLQRALALAAGLGARRVELTTNRTRESYARAFYTKNGFSEVDSAVMRCGSAVTPPPAARV